MILATRCKRGLSSHAVSVHLSVRMSVRPLRSWILSKRINKSSIFFHHRITKPFYALSAVTHDNRWLCTVRDLPSAVSRYTQSLSSVNRVCDSKARRYVEDTEQNRIIRTGKSEAKVINNKKLRSRYCTVEAYYWQTGSIARPLCDSRATCT